MQWCALGDAARRPLTLRHAPALLSKRGCSSPSRRIDSPARTAAAAVGVDHMKRWYGLPTYRPSSAPRVAGQGRGPHAREFRADGQTRACIWLHLCSKLCNYIYRCPSLLPGSPPLPAPTDRCEPPLPAPTPCRWRFPQGVEYWCFHDRDIAPKGKTLKETNTNLDKIVALAKELQGASAPALFNPTTKRYRDGCAPPQQLIAALCDAVTCSEHPRAACFSRLRVSAGVRSSLFPAAPVIILHKLVLPCARGSQLARPSGRSGARPSCSRTRYTCTAPQPARRRRSSPSPLPR